MKGHTAMQDAQSKKRFHSKTSLRTLSVGAIMSSLLLSTINGCGAEIRPDGPKRVVFTQPDGSQKIFETSPGEELRELAIDQLIVLASHDAPEVRANAIEALAPVQAQAEPIVALALSDSNPGVRSVAAMICARSNFNTLAPSVRMLIDDPSPFVRASSMFALWSFGEEVDINELSEMLFESKSPNLRSHAAFVLGEMGDETAIPLLQAATRMRITNASPIEKTLFRLQLAEALMKLGHEESIDTIRAALYPSRVEDLEATALAVQIIGQLKDEHSVDQLIYLADPESDTPMPAEVRLGVALSLAKLEYREGSFVADEYMASDIDSARALSAVVYGMTSGKENLGKLEMMMVNDQSILTRVAAAGAIIQHTQSGFAGSRANGKKRN